MSRMADDVKRPLSPNKQNSLMYGSSDISQRPQGGQTAEVVVRDSKGLGDDGSGDQFVGVSFHDLVYVVKTGLFGGIKEILRSVSGVLPPGLNAIMGPTGSGKTTLLDILAGRKNKSYVRGHVLVNGHPQPKNFKCQAGYVVQDDIVMGTLSVRENLLFSAALRLPSSTTWKQRKQRVEKVIRELGLERCANTKIGTEFFRGVSGGERKRTNIGMELIIEPQILFLDEPTTGLDAYTAVSVVQLLKSLSERGDRMIIMSIHQPRYSIYKLFDTLTMLSQGDMVYHGPATASLDYFENIGYKCEQRNNPADYYLDILTQAENSQSKTETPVVITDLEQQGDDAVAGNVDFVTTYSNSQMNAEVQERLQGLLESRNNNWRNNSVGIYTTNFFWQLLIVSIRSSVNLIRNPMISVFQVLVMVIFALVVGLIYLRLDEKEVNTRTVIMDRLGAFYFIVLNQVFGNLSAVDVFIKQKPLFIHENSSGFYRVSVFFLSKVFNDLIPMRMLPAFVFSVIAYFMIGFQLDAAKFFIFLLTLSLTSIAAASIAFSVSAIVRVAGIANLFIALIFIFSMLFGGLFIALDSLPIWLRWLKYASLFRYSVEALANNEIVGMCYCTNSTLVSECDVTSQLCVNGTSFLTSLGYETAYEWLWIDIAGLCGIALFFLCLTYINLRLLKKEK